MESVESDVGCCGSSCCRPSSSVVSGQLVITLSIVGQLSDIARSKFLQHDARGLLLAASSLLMNCRDSLSYVCLVAARGMGRPSNSSAAVVIVVLLYIRHYRS